MDKDTRVELRNKLISVKPIQRTKGFKNENISINNNQNDLFIRSYEKINTIYFKLSKSNITKAEKDILSKIKTS